MAEQLIARIDLLRTAQGYGYRVLSESETLYEDAGYSSVVHCLAGAVEGLPPEVRAVEVACAGIVSGTYPLTTLVDNAQSVAQHAIDTTASVYEALQG